MIVPFKHFWHFKPFSVAPLFHYMETKEGLYYFLSLVSGHLGALGRAGHDP